MAGLGNRLRPVLCVTAFQACGRDPGPATYDLAASLDVAPTLAWAVTGAVCLAAFFGLRREFLRAEIHSTPKEWTRVFS